MPEDTNLVELNSSSIESNQETDIISCRICFEPGSPLISPCNCRGTQLHVHQDCLDHWRNRHGRNNSNRNFCTTCKQEFDYRVTISSSEESVSSSYSTESDDSINIKDFCLWSTFILSLGGNMAGVAMVGFFFQPVHYRILDYTFAKIAFGLTAFNAIIPPGIYYVLHGNCEVPAKNLFFLGIIGFVSGLVTSWITDSYIVLLSTMGFSITYSVGVSIFEISNSP